MNLIHMLWLPFAYKVAPIWLGQHALRGMLKQRGIDLLAIPLPLSLALAEQTYKTHSLVIRFKNLGSKKLGLIAQLAEYQIALDGTAWKIFNLLYLENRMDTCLSVCHKEKEIMELFGIHVPPVLVDKNGQAVP